MYYIILIIILIVYWFVYVSKNKKESFIPDVSKNTVDLYSVEIYNNLHLFRDNKLKEVKQHLPWVDPVLYEDVRSILYTNQVPTLQNI